MIKGAAKALDFYNEAFGAEEVEREELPDGKLLHGSIRFGESLVMMFDEFPGSDAHNPGDLGTSTVVLHIYSDKTPVSVTQAARGPTLHARR